MLSLHFPPLPMFQVNFATLLFTYQKTKTGVRPTYLVQAQLDRDATS